MRLAPPPTSCKVPTPIDLANAIVSALGDKPEAIWLEPSHGDGSFLKALSQIGVSKNRIFALDLDTKPEPSDALANTKRGIDFLRWAAKTDRRFDFIVGNPPYVSIKRLRPSLRRIASRVADVDGNPIGTRGNTWYAFVVSAIRLLNDGGSFAFVLPSSAEFAEYAAETRLALKNSFASLEIYRSRKSMFVGIQEGTVVAIARGYGQGPFTYRRCEFDDKASVVNALLRTDSPRGRTCPKTVSSDAIAGIPFGDVAKIRLGGVTGDVTYFLMNEARRRELGLPTRAMTPVISKAKQLRSSVIDSTDWKSLRRAGERIWLFRPGEGDREHEKVRDYLTLTSRNGGCNKAAFKISRRDPWYQVPLPDQPDAFMSGMSQSGPWMSFNEMPGLNATNTLYVVTFHDRDSNEWYKWALSMLTTIGQKQIHRMGRRYTDGLVKFEPGLISKVRLPYMKSMKGYRAIYAHAIAALLSGDIEGSRKVADSNRATNKT